MAMASSVKSQAEKLRAQHEDYQKKEPRAPRVGRYHDYTPHNVSVAELCKEVGQVERFLKQKALEWGLTQIGSYFASTTTALDIRLKFATIFEML